MLLFIRQLIKQFKLLIKKRKLKKHNYDRWRKVSQSTRVLSPTQRCSESHTLPLLQQFEKNSRWFSTISVGQPAKSIQLINDSYGLFLNHRSFSLNVFCRWRWETFEKQKVTNSGMHRSIWSPQWFFFTYTIPHHSSGRRLFRKNVNNLDLLGPGNESAAGNYKSEISQLWKVSDFIPPASTRCAKGRP